MPDNKAKHDDKPDDRTAREHNKPGVKVPEIHSINEPGPDDPKPFKVTDEDAYPEGIEKRNQAERPEDYKPPEEDKPAVKAKSHKTEGYDPDDLEDEIDEAEEEGDITPSKSHGKSKRK